jgi:hypothetical protein
MLNYICKPSLYNNKGMKTFHTALDALNYLNEMLLPKDGDHEDYVFIAPSTARHEIKNSIEDYQYIGKLNIEWDLT